LALPVEEFTTSLVTHLGKKPEHIHIVIDEVEEENWGFFGMLTDDFRRRLIEEPRPEPGDSDNG